MKVGLSHHAYNETTTEWSQAKQLVFVMDEWVSEVKAKGKKVQKKVLTNKNYGAALSVPAVKSSKSLMIAWRCRKGWDVQTNLRPSLTYW